MENATFVPMGWIRKSIPRHIFVCFALIAAGLACSRESAPIDTGLTGENAPAASISENPDGQPTDGAGATPQGELYQEHAADPSPFPSPTLDPTRHSPTSTLSPGIYFVEPGDTIQKIADKFGVTAEAIIALNNLADPDNLQVGQLLHIPVPTSELPGPNFKIIPDSELVFGPASAKFNPEEYLVGRGGYLMSYRETVDGRSLGGPEIVLDVAKHFSVNPRLLLAVLEYTSGWITDPNPSEGRKGYPIVYLTGKEGLYKQLGWAADQMNAGYYAWKAGGADYWTLADGGMVRIGPGINAGTAGVQNLLAQLYSRTDWEAAVTAGGVFAVYQSMFGYPFSWAVEPLIPDGLIQPPLMLPFEPGVTWYFTGGPHGGWGSGSAWAALDFAPPTGDPACYESDAWELAAAAGVVVRSETGVVVLDLDMDGNEFTGWTLLYLHLQSRDRAPLGARLQRGDRIGHPGCEGGVSYASHLHIARRYNGEWIPADGPVPFNIDSWIPSSTGLEYEGWFTKEGVSLEACNCGAAGNAIWR